MFPQFFSLMSINEMNHLAKWLWRFLLTFIALLILTPIIFTVVENHRGAKQWQKVADELEAAGISLDIKSYALPLPKTGSENFAATPLIAALFESPELWARAVESEGPLPFSKDEYLEQFTKMQLPTLQSNITSQNGAPVDLDQIYKEIEKEGWPDHSLPETGTLRPRQSGKD